MKAFKRILAKKSGRSHGVVTVRHQGGREKRFLRTIDFRRSKKDIWGVVEKIEYDPNRNADIALILYEDGERCYILCPVGLGVFPVGRYERVAKKVNGSKPSPG